MAFDALAVANYFLDEARAEDKPLTPLALQKLVYFAHGWYLAFTGRPLVYQGVQAWDYGPVIPSIYHEFKEFGRNPITRKAERPERPPSGYTAWDDLKFVEPKLDADDKTLKLLHRVWDVYKKFSGTQLSNLTHQDGSPWAETRKGNPNLQRAVISDDLIEKFFKAQAEKNAAARSE